MLQRALPLAALLQWPAAAAEGTSAGLLHALPACGDCNAAGGSLTASPCAKVATEGGLHFLGALHTLYSARCD